MPSRCGCSGPDRSLATMASDPTSAASLLALAEEAWAGGDGEAAMASSSGPRTSRRRQHDLPGQDRGGSRARARPAVQPDPRAAPGPPARGRTKRSTSHVPGRGSRPRWRGAGPTPTSLAEPDRSRSRPCIWPTSRTTRCCWPTRSMPRSPRTGDPTTWPCVGTGRSGWPTPRPISPTPSPAAGAAVVAHRGVGGARPTTDAPIDARHRAVGRRVAARRVLRGDPAAPHRAAAPALRRRAAAGRARRRGGRGSGDPRRTGCCTACAATPHSSPGTPTAVLPRRGLRGARRRVRRRNRPGRGGDDLARCRSARQGRGDGRCRSHRTCCPNSRRTATGCSSCSASSKVRWRSATRR